MMGGIDDRYQRHPETPLAPVQPARSLHADDRLRHHIGVASINA
jgi:hypothetical protein